jgi:hypothetical protein
MKLDRLTASLAEGRIDPVDAALLLAGIAAGSVDVALGLRPKTPLERRDELICVALAQFFAGSARARARACETRWARYESGPWIRERLLDALPQRRVGTVEAIFWECLKLHPHPLRFERLRRMIGGYFEIPNDAGKPESEN